MEVVFFGEEEVFNVEDEVRKGWECRVGFECKGKFGVMDIEECFIVMFVFNI